MAKIAKIALSADIKDFQTKMKETKKAFMDLSQMKISPKVTGEFEKKFKEDLVQSADALKSKISEVEASMETLAKKRSDVYNSDEVQKLATKHAEYNRELKRTNDLLAEMENKGGPPEPPGEGGGSGGGWVGRGRRALGGIRGMAGTVGLSLGIGALFQRSQGIARQQIATRALTGGEVVGGESQLGFTNRERRERGLDVARAAGRDMSGRDLTAAVDLGEQIERAFNITGAEQAQVQSAARRAGVDNQQKFMADAIGDAVAAGLSGSSINEYLQSMAGYMEGMSKGIDVNDSSLRGISAALADTPFFKNDPQRIFQALNDLDQMFKKGDRFQEAMSNMAIRQAAGGGGSPAAVYMRRQMGLFGDLKLTDKQKAFLGEDAKALETKPQDILQNIFKNIMATGEGRTGTAQLQRFQSATGMGMGAAKDIFFKMKEGGKLDEADLRKFKDAQKTPEQLMADRIQKTMDDHSKSILEGGKAISNAMDNLAMNVGPVVGNVVTAIDKNIISLDKLTGAIMALTAVQTASGLLDIMKFFKGKGGGGDILSKGKDLLKGGWTKGKDLFKAGMEGMKKIPFKRMAGEGLKKGGKFLSRIGPVASRAAGVVGALWPSEIGGGENDPEQMFIDEQIRRAEMAKGDKGGMSVMSPEQKKKLSSQESMLKGVPQYLARPQQQTNFERMSPIDESNTKATDANTIALQKLTELLQMIDLSPVAGGMSSPRSGVRVGGGVSYSTGKR